MRQPDLLEMEDRLEKRLPEASRKDGRPAGQAGPILLLALISVGFFWKFTIARQYTWLDHPDNVYQVLPWLQYQAAQLHQGRFPLWDPHLQAGLPVVGQVQPATLNPVNLLFLLWPLRDGMIRLGTVNWFFVTGHFLAALFFYVFLRDQGVSRSGAVFGGCAFSFAGFPGSVGWPQILYSMVPLPLVMMFCLRGQRRRPLTNHALGGLFLGMGFLGGHHNVPIFLAVVLACYWCYEIATLEGAHRGRAAAAYAIFFACAGMAAAPVLAPAWEFGQHALRWVNAPVPVNWRQTVPYSVHNEYSFYPTSLLGIVIPQMYRHTSPFLGWAVAGMALLGVASRGREKRVRFCLAVALVGLAFTLGSASLLHGVLYSIAPGLDKARNPSMAIAVFHLGACALAAFGVDSFRGPFPSVSKRWLDGLLRGTGGYAAVVFAILMAFNSVRPERGEEYKFLMLSALGAAGLAALLAAWRANGLQDRHLVALLVCLMLSEAYNVSTYSYRPVGEPFALPKLQENRDVARFLRELPGRPRVMVDEAEIPYNFGDWYGVDQLGGYLPALLEEVARTQQLPAMQRILGAGYFVGRQPPGAGWEDVYTGSSGVRVFRREGTLARLRTVHQTVGAADSQEAADLATGGGLDPAMAASIAGSAPDLETCSGADSVKASVYLPGRVRLTAGMACKGMLVLADAWYPGWQAEVDGTRVQVYRAYGVVRGVVVPAGRHTVEFQYRPFSLYFGLATALLGLGIPLAARRYERGQG